MYFDPVALNHLHAQTLAQAEALASLDYAIAYGAKVQQRTIMDYVDASGPKTHGKRSVSQRRRSNHRKSKR